MYLFFVAPPGFYISSYILDNKKAYSDNYLFNTISPLYISPGVGGTKIITIYKPSRVLFAIDFVINSYIPLK